MAMKETTLYLHIISPTYIFSIRLTLRSTWGFGYPKCLACGFHDYDAVSFMVYVFRGSSLLIHAQRVETRYAAHTHTRTHRNTHFFSALHATHFAFASSRCLPQFDYTFCCFFAVFLFLLLFFLLLCPSKGFTPTHKHTHTH